MIILVVLVSCNTKTEEIIDVETTYNPPVEKKVVTIEISPMIYSENSLNENYFNSWTEYISEKFNIEISITAFQRINFYDAGRSLEQKILSGELSGIVYIPSSAFNVIYKLIEHGKIVPLNDILDSNQGWSNLPEDMRDISRINGTIWGIPDQFNPFYFVRSYNKNWLLKSGTTKPSTIAEFYETLGAFTEEDPDGDGIDNTKGTVLSINNMIDVFCDFRFYVQPTNGVFVFSSISYNPEKMIFEDSMHNQNADNALSFIKTLYENGYADIAWEKGINYGTKATYKRNDSNMFSSSLISPYGMFTYEDNMEYSIGFEGNTSGQVLYNYDGGIYVVCSNTEDIENKVNAFLDVFYNNKSGYYSGKYGIEQEAFYFEGNNVYVNAKDIINNGIPSLVGFVDGMHTNDNIIDTLDETAYEKTRNSKTFLKKLANENDSKIYELFPKTGFLVYEKEASYSIDGNKMTISAESETEKLLKLFNETYNKMLSEDISVSDSIENYKTESEKLGLTKYLKEINDMLD